ncbi:MAG: hypothetical protein RLZ98_2885 [Pseudomonadota bacterium]|jgi:esterase/lipase superfamily enzyme
MFDLPPVAYHLLIALVTLLLYVVVWRATAPMPATPRVLSRIVLALLLMLPLVIALLAIYEKDSAPTMATAPAQKRSPIDPERAREEMRVREAESRRVATQAQRAERAAKPAPPPAAAPEPPSSIPDAAPPPVAPPRSSEFTGLGLDGTGKGGGSAPQGSGTIGARPPGQSLQDDQGGAAGGEAKWDVVPVFYGTDRQRADTGTRIVYGPARAKRLELGRALVTVPKSHQVPQVERPWVYKLPFTQIVIYQEKEDPAKHFTLKEMRQLSKEDFLALVKARLAASMSYKDHALVFVHGFSVTFDNALYRTAQIAYDLKFDGAPFLYSWPSNGVVGPQDYSSDRESTGQAEPYLKEFLKLVSGETGAKSVSVIAHSMGSQLLMRVLRDLRQTAPDSVAISEIILAAPDVDRDTFEFLAREIKGLPRGMTLLAASNDRALEVSRRFWGGTPRAGDVPLDTGPIVLEGVDTIDVTAINTDLFSLNHGAYAEKPALLKDIEILIRAGTRPPKQRVPELELKATSTGASYWRYPSAR